MNEWEEVETQKEFGEVMGLFMCLPVLTIDIGCKGLFIVEGLLFMRSLSPLW